MQANQNPGEGHWPPLPPSFDVGTMSASQS